MLGISCSVYLQSKFNERKCTSTSTEGHCSSTMLGLFVQNLASINQSIIIILPINTLNHSRTGHAGPSNQPLLLGYNSPISMHPPTPTSPEYLPIQHSIMAPGQTPMIEPGSTIARGVVGKSGHRSAHLGNGIYERASPTTTQRPNIPDDSTYMEGPPSQAGSTSLRVHL